MNSSADADSDFCLDRNALERAFNRAGPDYDPTARALQISNAELLERLRFFNLKPDCILDLGAGPGHTSLQLRHRFPAAQIVALDLAPAMLATAPRGWWPRWRFHRVAGDAYALPLRSHSVDLVYSNLMLPFCDQPAPVFHELARVLKPGGLFLFASFGPDSLRELRAAWRCVDHAAHVSQFLDVPQLGDALMQSGLIEPVIDVEQHQLQYPDVDALMRELKRAGAQNAVHSRFRGLTGKIRLRRMISAYEQHASGNGVPATFELVIGAAFAPTAVDAHGRGQPPGEFAVPAMSIRRRQR